MQLTIPAVTPARLTVTVLLASIFGLGIVVQRLGVWVGGFPLACSMLFAIVVPLGLWRYGFARFERNRLLLYCLFAFIETLCAVTNTAHMSLPSFLLFLGLYFPFCLSVSLPEPEYERLQRLYAVVAMVFGLIGVLQYAAQFVVPNRTMLFTWAWILPPGFLIEYNSLNYLTYGSSVLKSNAFVFLEASAVSQLLARTLLIGRYFELRGLFVGLTLLGIAVTYSGGGMVLIAIFAVPLLLRELSRTGGLRLRAALPYIVVPAVVLLLALGLTQAGVFNLATIVGRATEIVSPGTSGYARYGSSTWVIEQAFKDRGLFAWLFGLGPGQSTPQGFSVPVFTTAWVKLLIEYGVVGLTACVGFVGYCIWSSSRSFFIFSVLMFCFFLLDSNLLVPQYVFFLLMLGVLPKRELVAQVSAQPAFYHQLSVAPTNAG